MPVFLNDVSLPAGVPSAPVYVYDPANARVPFAALTWALPVDGSVSVAASGDGMGTIFAASKVEQVVISVQAPINGVPAQGQATFHFTAPALGIALS